MKPGLVVRTHCGVYSNNAPFWAVDQTENKTKISISTQHHTKAKGDVDGELTNIIDLKFHLGLSMLHHHRRFRTATLPHGTEDPICAFGETQ